MELYILLYLIVCLLSSTTFCMNLDYPMPPCINTIFVRETTPLDPQQACNKLIEVASLFWNSNTKAVVNYIKNEHNSIQQTLQALSFMQEAIELGQALQQSKILKDFENQYLLAAIVIDKITLLTNQLNTTDVIQFNPEIIICMKAQLTDILDSLNLMNKKFDYNYLEVATKVVLQISQPQLAHEKIINLPIRKTQTIGAYVQKSNDTNLKETLQNYTSIITTQDDGNCGYRTLLASFLMQAVDAHDKKPIIYLEKLITDKFQPLFMDHDQLFPKKIKLSIAHTLQKHLIKQLKKVATTKNIEQVKDMWNEDPVFDFYMIKFLRYLILNYIDEHKELSETMHFIYRDFAQYQKNICSWGYQITELELNILASAMQTTISIQDQNNTDQKLTIYQATPENYSIFMLKKLQQNFVLIPKKINLQSFLTSK